jgi:hypothetical protein
VTDQARRISAAINPARWGMRLRHLALLIALLVPAATFAQQPKTPPQRQQDAGVLRLLPEDSVSDHSIKTRDGKKLDYATTAGTLDLFGQDGQRMAAIFYVAYVRKESNARRPVTFVFNGGPGAASAYLHLGLAGPRIASFGPDGRDGANAKIVDNPDTWLASPISSLSTRSAPAGAGPSSRMTPRISTMCAATRRCWRKSSRSTPPRTAAARRRNTCSARAMAASGR